MSEKVQVYNNSKNPWQIGNTVCHPGMLTPVDKPSWDAFRENHVGKSVVREKMLMEGKPEVVGKANVPTRAEVFATMTVDDVPQEIKRQILKEGVKVEAASENRTYSEADLEAMDSERLKAVAQDLGINVGRKKDETLILDILASQEG